MSGNPPVKCAYCETRFPDPAKAVQAGGMGNGIAWVCDGTCEELWKDRQHENKNNFNPPQRRAGRDPDAADREFHGEGPP